MCKNYGINVSIFIPMNLTNVVKKLLKRKIHLIDYNVLCLKNNL